MDSDLVGAACFQANLQQAVWAKICAQTIVGAGWFAIGTGGKLLPVAGVSSQGHVNHPFGRFGAAKNLCDFAVNGPDCSVQPEVVRLVREVHQQGKPVAAVCIAPALLAKVLGDETPELTIGTDEDTAGALEKMGARHVSCPVRDFVVDSERKLITSPAYMLAQSISEAAEGIEKTVTELLALA